MGYPGYERGPGIVVCPFTHSGCRFLRCLEAIPQEGHRSFPTEGGTADAVQHVSLRLLLRPAPAALLGPPASSPELSPAGGELLLLRLLGSPVPVAPDPLDGDGLRLRPGGRPDRRSPEAEAVRGAEHAA